MNWDQIATDLAAVLVQHEPEKRKGGSADRQQWLGLVMTIQVEMLEHGVGETFQKELLS